MNFTEVSQSAFLPLISRATETEKKNPVINDPMAVFCLAQLKSIASDEQKNRIIKWEKRYKGFNGRDARARALQSKTFDTIADKFISNHPNSTVINLACGFDTRYWRIQGDKCHYVELDLPEMINLKTDILKHHLDYELIGCSVLDPSWIDQVTSNGNRNFLLLAEGLFYYLPKQSSIRLLQEISHRFEHSQLVLDMVPEKYTRGIWKWLLSLESKAWDLDVTLVFGINNPQEIETYASGFKVIESVKGSIGSIITVSINAT